MRALNIKVAKICIKILQILVQNIIATFGNYNYLFMIK